MKVSRMNANSLSRKLALMLVLSGGFLAALFGRTPFSTATAQDDPASSADEQPALLADASAEEPQPDTAPVAAAPPAPVLTDLKLSPGIQQIVKLAQAGVGDDVMLAYIGTVTTKFNLGSDQIIFLNDIGVSGAVIKAMIQRDVALDEMWRSTAAAAMLPTNPTAVPYPGNPGTYPPTPMDDSGAVYPPDMTDYSTVAPGDYTPTDDADYFYGSLAPYGNWTFVADAGLCWQPTVCVGNHDWRPYWDRGRWIYSDCGWYWQSDYSWGWGPFHYGRWFQDAKRGWCWQPDRNWGPAWVSWRQTADYCGWAPLPPGAKYVPGVGLQSGPRPIGTPWEFGLRAAAYNFIPLARMTDYTPSRYGVSSAKQAELLTKSATINKITFENNKLFVHGVSPQAVAAAAKTEVRHAKIQEVAPTATGRVQTDWLAKRSDGLVIYRPQLPQPAPSRPATATGVPRIYTPGPARSSGPVKTSQAEPVTPATRALASASVAAPAPQVHNFIMRGSNIEPAPVEDYPPDALVILARKNASQPPPVYNGPVPNMKLQPPPPAEKPFVYETTARPGMLEEYGPTGSSLPAARPASASLPQPAGFFPHSQTGSSASPSRSGVEYFGYSGSAATPPHASSESGRPFDDLLHSPGRTAAPERPAVPQYNNDFVSQVRHNAESHPAPAPASYHSEPPPQPVHHEPPHESPPPPAPVHVEAPHSSPPAAPSSSGSSSSHK